MRREAERLQDILDAIVAIERYTIQGKQAFDEQELIQVWMVHHFQIIGEAANALSPERLSQYPSIPWSWLAEYHHQDVAIATYEIDFQQWRTLSSKLEGIILIWSKPPFNIRIPMREES